MTRRWIIQFGIIIALISILIGLSFQPASGVVITEFKLPVDVRPRNVVVDDSNRVWFTEEFGNKIGYKSGTTIHEFTVPTVGSNPFDLVWDEERDEIWFTEFDAGKIVRFKKPVFIEFNLVPFGPDPDPMGIAIDQNRTFQNIWFTEFSSNAIGKIYYNTTGPLKDRWVYVRYLLGGVERGPMDIAVSPIDRTVWFTQYENRRIGNFNPWTQVFTEYPIAIPGLGATGFRPMELAIDSDGFIWFTVDLTGTDRYDKIGRLNPWNSEFVFYDIPTLDSGPLGIVVDEQNHIWFTESEKSKIGRLDPVSRFITEFDLPDSASMPKGITTSQDKETPIWFTEWGGNRIGMLDPDVGKSFSTVTTITSATTSQTTKTDSTTTTNPASVTTSVVFSTRTTANVEGTDTVVSPTVTFKTATGTSSTNRFASSSVTTKNETVFVDPTSTTITTTSFIVSTSTTETTTTGTLTSFVSTTSTTTTATTSATSSSAIATETSFTTREAVFRDYVSTTIITEFASTSFRFRTTTEEFFTSFSTSKVIRATTQSSLTTITVTSFTTETALTTETTETETAPFQPVIPGFSPLSIIVGVLLGVLIIFLMSRISPLLSPRHSFTNLLLKGGRIK